MPNTDSFDKYEEPKLHMERLMKAHLIEFDLSLRILCPLERAGINTLGKLLKNKRDNLLKIPNIGNTAISTIELFLARYNLSLPQ